MMLFEVLKDYKSDNPNHIQLMIGETIELGEVSNPDGPYPNWIFCTSKRTGGAGWVAVHALEMEDGVGTAIEEYTSKEMAVTSGDIVDSVYELNGWYWCVRTSDFETGWVAKDNVEART